MTERTLLWAIFGAVVLVMMALDLCVFPHRPNLLNALIWSGVWIGLAMVFTGLVCWWQGPHIALNFLTGYVIEESLSVDNLFVFLVLFSYFRVSPEHQHGVLFWGILGAMIFRGIFVVAGVALIHRFACVIYLFGALLVGSGLNMAFRKARDIQPERNPVLRLFRRVMPVSEQNEGGRFFVRRDGRTLATPLFVVLLVIETTDIIFAVDSVPAVLAITTDPLVVYTSNVFAILGLRSLYFVLAGFTDLFHYLRHGLSAILIFVGIKMIVAHLYQISVGVALGVVAGILALSIIASLLWPIRKTYAVGTVKDGKPTQLN